MSDGITDMLREWEVKGPKWRNKRAKDVSVLVVGDVMLDHYIIGKVEKISPEAPVPVVNVTEEYTNLGGAGNVARNVKSLGSNVKILGRVGQDSAADKIYDHLNSLEIEHELLKLSDIDTTQKIRVIAELRDMQMLRIDKENVNKREYNPSYFYDIIGEKEYDVIIISDYAKGFITEGLMDVIRSYNSDKCPVIVDPKPEHSHMYNEVFMVTPNSKELREMRKLHSIPYCRFLLETKGKNGMHLTDNHKNKQYRIEGNPVEVYNVTGAGDTVVSVIAVGLGMGFSALEMAHVANECASYVVTQTGTTTISKDFFNSKLEDIIR